MYGSGLKEYLIYLNGGAVIGFVTKEKTKKDILNAVIYSEPEMLISEDGKTFIKTSEVSAIVENGVPKWDLDLYGLQEKPTDTKPLGE